MREVEITIDTEEISEFLFTELIKKGHVPDENILNDLSDIIFDYLIYKDIIEEDIE